MQGILNPSHDAWAAYGPSGLYLTGEEHLRITTFNAAAGVTLAIEARQLDAEGRMRASADRHVPNTDRTSQSTIVQLGAGWLLDVAIRATAGTPRVGQCFAVLELVRGLTGAVVPVAVLAQGYVTDTQRLGFPASRVRSSTEGRGVIRSVTGSDPAAGAEIVETVPTNARWRLIAMGFRLVTDATVANRIPVLTLDDGATTFFRTESGVNVTASLTSDFHAFATNALAGAANNRHYLALPPELYLMGGHRLQTVTTAIQAGDNYGAPQMLVEEWIED